MTASGATVLCIAIVVAWVVVASIAVVDNGIAGIDIVAVGIAIALS